jgi:hypothetical protein
MALGSKDLVVRMTMAWSANRTSVNVPMAPGTLLSNGFVMTGQFVGLMR